MFADMSGLYRWLLEVHGSATTSALIALGIFALGYFISKSLVTGIENSSLSHRDKIAVKIFLPLIYFLAAGLLTFALASLVGAPSRLGRERDNSNIGKTLPYPHLPLQTDWQRIKIENVGTIDIPPTMEVQSGEYKEWSEGVREKFKFKSSVPQLVIQQRGLNESRKEALNRYARITVETEYGSAGDYPKLNFDTAAEQGEVNNLNLTFKNQIIQNLSGIGNKLITWYPLKLDNINGMSCMHLNFIRQRGDNPHVLVHTYIFPNYDRIHRLTFSYRVNEQDIWKEDFIRILQSFRITTINY